MTTIDVAMYAAKPEAYFGGARCDIEPLLPERPGRVLEIGCGDGATLRWLRSRGGVTGAPGIELMQAAATRARETADEVICGNVEEMELPAGPYDLILALDVLEHLVDPWATVRRLHAILSPGGSMIASIPNIAHYSVALRLAAGGEWRYMQEGLLDRTHLRFFTETTALELMTSSGLVLRRVERELLGPAWLRHLPRSLRWYSLRALGAIVPRNLLVLRFLIRAVAAQSA